MRNLATNLRTFLLALVLAIAVWISAVTAADPDEVRPPLTIPVEIVGKDNALVMTNANAVPASIEVTLRTPQSVWERLTAQEGSVRAFLDLSGLSAGEHMVDIKLQVTERPTQIVLANPITATVILEPFATQTLEINLSLSGQSATGYRAGDPILDPLEVTISGPKSLVEQASRARVQVNLSGTRENVDQAVPIEILDEKNTPLNNITVAPKSVHVSIPISQQGGFRDVAVKVVVQGQQAPGYRLETISVFPPVVTVFASDPQLIKNISGVVETKPLDITDAKNDISTRLELSLPENITVVGAQTVQVDVGISAIQTSLTLLNQQINIIGLPEGMIAQISPQTVDVILSGPLPILDVLTPQDITISVDVTGLDIGVHQLAPKVSPLVENVLVESVLPGTIEVTLSQPVTPPATPKP
jgi:YbbR domain-containing protein